METVIDIEWEGPLSLVEAIRLQTDSDYGLYQYYGDHPVYGSGVLLYIGEAGKQTFGKRIAQHNWHRWIPSPTEIYVGRICSTEPLDAAEWRRRISLAEAIEIFAHSPAFNTQNLNSIGHKGPDVRVLNWGKRKGLFPEVSISRWEGPRTVGHDLPRDLTRCVSLRKAEILVIEPSTESL